MKYDAMFARYIFFVICELPYLLSIAFPIVLSLESFSLTDYKPKLKSPVYSDINPYIIRWGIQAFRKDICENHIQSWLIVNCTYFQKSYFLKDVILYGESDIIITCAWHWHFKHTYYH